MRGTKPLTIESTPRLKVVLTKITHRATSPQFEVQRTKMILAAAAGTNNQQVADRLGVRRQTVRKWRQRWSDATERLNAAANEVDPVHLVQSTQYSVQCSRHCAKRTGLVSRCSPVPNVLGQEFARYWAAS